nr:uncharacterized protein LOC129421245 isoform X1 [Misgurnus anguillicaudatus]
MGFLMSLCVALLLMNDEVRSLNPSTTSTTTTESATSLPITTTASVDNLSYDPCYNYTSLDRPWRATNESGLYICDESFYWDGWYRLYYNGMNIRMSESCVSSYSCNTYASLWLSGSHPQVEDGVVTLQLLASAWGYCSYNLQSIQVKACPGGYYVYELVNPQFWCSAYCTDINTLTEADPSTNPDTINEYSTTLPSTITSYDPCYNYKTLDNEWRNTRTYLGVQYDDTMTEWDGWYRLFINGVNAEIPEWCLNDMTCGGYSPLWLNDSHPRLEDGVVTLEVYSSSRYGQCISYRSNSIEVKACPDNYYVYKLTRPSVTIPAPVYCAVAFSSSSVDPCDSYTSLDDSWRSTSNYNYYYYYGAVCDYNINWNGWYRLYYQGQDAQMPESCVNYGSCGTSQPLWLNGRHPQLEDGVVTRKICGSTGNDCCGYTSHPIRVKACPGNYYVYEFVSPTACSAYCTEVRDLNPSTTPSTTTESTTPVSITASVDNLSYDPCYNYTSLDRPWRATNESGLYICDESFYWDGWYRLYYNGMNIRMSESCVSSYSCNTYASLWLSGSHPQIEDGVVTLQLLASAWGYCSYNLQSIQVKACPGGYYVYELVNPQFWCSAYCTDINTLTVADPSTNPDMVNEYSTTLPSTITSYDPCYNYKTLDNEWRNTRTYLGVQYDDTMTEWDGWYRFFINGMNAEIPEWCLNDMTCGGYSPLWLNDSHPRLEDGVVTLEVYSSSRYGQCISYRSNSIEVKACPDNYYVYKLTRPSVTIPAPVYCAVAFSSSSVDPCDSYTSLDDSWRSTSNYNYYYYYGAVCDYNMNWNGWYRLYYQGQDAQMPESCVNYGSCGTSQPLWLNGRHPQLEDGVVTRKICGSNGNDCCGYTSHPIRVKACPWNYYVYEFVSPIACSAYCTEVRDLNPSTTPSTTTESTTPVSITASLDNLSYDPCYNYTSLDRPWRATNESGLYICDESFYWDGWYRLYYNGMNIRMSESCVSSYSCNTYASLWLSGSHPQIEDGVVTLQLLASAWGYCSYNLQSIQVKACPGGYYVYELVNPQFWCSAYCTDINTLTVADPSTNPDMVNEYSTTLPSTITSYDPCYNYKTLDNEWRNTRTYLGVQYDDTMTEWDGWYRFFINGMNAEIPEWCLNDMTCGGYSPLWLNGSHPRLEDGVVTLEVYSSSRYGQCSSYRSNSIEVKACPDNYYVYKLTRPSVTIPAPVYCAVAFSSSSVDPCDSYTGLNDSWRSTSNYNYYYYYGAVCDYNMNWNGWYRLYYQGQDAQMPESCVNYGSCGTSQPLWLNGRHPQLEDGVVTRKICGSNGNDCCGYTSHPIRVKACPGNYYVYEFVSPIACSAYCTEVRDLNPSTTPSTTTESTTPVSITASLDNLSYDPCYNYTSLDRPWRATNESGLYICDESFYWDGWYRLYYNGMNIRMSESCVSSYSCNAYASLWLSGSHPQVEDGVVTLQLLASAWGYCSYNLQSIQVKACPGGYYVYELVNPQFWCSAYCTDINTLTVADPSTNPDMVNEYSTTLPSTITSYDPCYNYKTLNNEWRNTRTYLGVQYDDTMTEWDGWYRFFINGMNAEIPEWCLNDMTCGGYSPLWLNGSHPRLEDGVVTLEVYSSSRYGQCSSYRSNSIEVKACPDNYYVYKLTRPSVTIPAPVYCAVAFTSLSIDPCDSYTSLDDSWRSTSQNYYYYSYYYGGMCDYNMNWNGWYRLYYQGQDAQMPESCVNYGLCGTSQPLWLNGRHPQLEDGVVTRKICGSTGNDCCGYTSHPIRVKACPGNYYVYEFVSPTACSAYCTEVRELNPSTTPSTTTKSTTPVPITASLDNLSYDPCYNYTSLDRPWRATNESGLYICDESFYWDGWYRLYYNGMNIRMSESCVSSYSCNAYASLWLSSGHPQIEDGVVTRQLLTNAWGYCGYYYYYLQSIQVKACPGGYYVYELINPQFWCSAYCTDINTLTVADPSTNPEMVNEYSTSLPSTITIYDPCYNYKTLDNEWRNTRTYWGVQYDDTMTEWDGWYRLFINGVNAEIPEWCLNDMTCGGYSPLWLNGSHPRLEDGVVTLEVYSSSRYGQCSSYRSNSIEVKACPDNYYVYKLTRPSVTIPAPIYCAVAFTSMSIDPCDSYTSLDDSWRSTSQNYYYYYYSGMCDYNMIWNGWYRLYYQGQDAQMPESCVNYGSCGTSQPLWLNGRHPQLEDGVVTRKICGSTGNDCCGYTSHPIRVKACPGNYYVYEFVSPASCSAYCTEVRDLNPSTTPSTTTESTTPVPITASVDNLSYDPCYNYTSLDRPWRATNESGLYICDEYFSWHGWYRLYYNGMNIRMSEDCVSSYSCNAYVNLWLSGAHPQIEDGVVTRQVFGSYWRYCSYFMLSIQVKACSGGYFVYELVSPQSWCSGYCTDINTLTEADLLTNPTGYSTTLSSTITNYDPCYNYKTLDNEWRNTRTYWGVQYDDTMTEWDGWYRLFINGMNAEIPEWCLNDMTCGGYSPLWLNDSHPRLEDGVVTLEVYSSSRYGQCSSYRSNSIEVKACPDNYYVYKLTRPSVTIPAPVYCAVAFTTPRIDPCDSYTSLDDSWRSTSNYYYYYYYYSAVCDYNMNWNGWYRLYYQGQDAQMPESCVNYGSCGTSQPLWLNGRHPQLEDGVVTRKICGSNGNDCCGYTSHPIRVKACPGNYYVYEFVSPTACSAYCTEVKDLHPLTTLATTITESTTPVPITVTFTSLSIDPCDSYTSLDDSWRSTSNYNYYYYYYYYSGMCDYNINWNGWYRLYYQGQDAQMPESCVNYGYCGTSQPMWLNGRHPQLEDGVVTRQVCSSSWNDCCGYTSHPIRVKACPGNYYVYEFVSPSSCSAYCTEVRDLNPPTTLSTTTTESTTPVPITVTFTSLSIDPCDSYTSLDDSWRSTSNYNYYYYYYGGMCDYNINWNGWYRLYYQGQDAQMPESCVNYGYCGTSQPMWLNGRHPQLEDGVVTRQVCSSSWNDCCGYTSHPIRVKACPGNYYVYEFVSPTSCSAYCTEVRQLSPTTASTTTEESTTSLSITTIDPCTEINCTEEEWCGEKDGIYGCFCNHPRSDPDSYDSFEICESSSGFLSLSRCQLFEDGFIAEILHLRDARCKGTVQNGRVEFHFDKNNMCGTNLMANGTHFIYENIILGEVKSTQLISRKSHLNLSFSCIYSQTQTLSMNTQINPLESHLHRTIPTGAGTYKVRMVPYQDPDFSQPFTGSVNIEVDEPIYVELKVEGIDEQQFALLIDTCWATPVNDPLYNVRWDLLVGECPNPKDDTVVLLQNGVSTSSRFSFRMFTFTENFEKVFLHCSIHICLLMGNDCSAHCESGYHRRPRSVDFHDSSSISMGPLIWS